MDRYRISQLAERVGLPATTLRYYGSQGLLPAQRTPSGYRTYDDHDVERVRFISAAKAFGLSLDHIRELLDVWQHGPCRDVRDRLRPRIRQQIDRATERMTELGVFRDHLTSAIARLDSLPSRDTPCDPACASLATDADRPALTPRPVLCPPVACSLTATEYDDRAARWRTALAGTTRTPLPDGGVRVQFPAGAAEEIAALVAAESRCCPFFTFQLTLSGTGVVLDAHAPADALPLLEELLGQATATPARSCRVPASGASPRGGPGQGVPTAPREVSSRR